jgi:hypothetical protein
MATVVISIQAFRYRLEAMTVPRMLITQHILGRPLGPPGDRHRQREAILAALSLLETAERTGTVSVLAGSYRPIWCEKT